MPNTPALIGKGISGLFARPAVSSADKDWIGQVMASTGEFLWLDAEGQLNRGCLRRHPLSPPSHRFDLAGPCAGRRVAGVVNPWTSSHILGKSIGIHVPHPPRDLAARIVQVAERDRKGGANSGARRLQAFGRPVHA